MKSSTSIEQNEYAKDNFSNHVYIRDVVSGQKGYWCIGCGFEMIDVHGTIENRNRRMVTMYSKKFIFKAK
ncbi:hypothetical protein [Flavobacterium sp. LS2R12]|uniref:hypothetical protein n=1 Tax=unclassified Flavobacterium TaxID=196869 RepID=UPI003AB0A1E8